MIQRFEDQVEPSPRRSSRRAAGSGSGDFVPDVAARLPLKIICDMMGIPTSEHYQTVLDATNVILAGDDAEFVPDDPEQTAMALLTAGETLKDLVEELGRQRRTDPDRRPDVRARQRQHRRRVADRPGARLVLHPAGRRGQRDHPQRDRARPDLFTRHPDQRALLAEDFEARIARRRRGDRPVRLAGHLDAPHRDPRHHAERARRSRQATSSSSTTGRPTATSRCSPTRRSSTSCATPTRTSGSAAPARTSASARTSPAARSP